MTCPRAILFDLDDTLAESFKAPSQKTVDALLSLLALRPVAILTGAGLERPKSQFLGQLAASSHIDRFFILPNSASQSFVFKNGDWQQEYNILLSPEERERITKTLLETLESLPEYRAVPHFGQQLFDREAQIAYTVVGIDAPYELKKGWDPDGAKRRHLCGILKEKLPGFDVLVGGASTIDITREGANKAYGVRWLSERLGIPSNEMLYIGDALFPGGNDEVVIPTGIKTRATSGPEETLTIANALIAECAA